MTDKPVVSVIVPAYNAARTIGECIDSVLKQDFDDFELIVVNDGSLDRTNEIVDSFARVDERVICVTKKNGGVSTARNEGLLISRGEYAVFLDADDYLLPGSLDALLSAFTPTTSLVIGSHLTFRRFAEMHAFQKKCALGERTLFSEGAEELLGPIDSFFSTPWGKMYRLAPIREASLRFPDIPYSEDHLFNLRYLLATEGDVRLISKLVYGYALGGLASSFKFHPNRVEISLAMLSCYEEECRFSNRFCSDDPFFETVPQSLLDGVLLHFNVCLPEAQAIKSSRQAIHSFNEAWFHDAPLEFSPYFESWKRRNSNTVLRKRVIRTLRQCYRKMVSRLG